MTLEEFVNFVVNSPYETVANELERNYRTPMVSDIRTIEQKQDATQKMAYAVSVYAFLSPVRARVNYKKSVCDKKSAEYAVLIRKARAFGRIHRNRQSCAGFYIKDVLVQRSGIRTDTG